MRSLEALVESAGHRPILFPTLKIEPIKSKPLKDHYDAVIFISANAVEHGLEVLSLLDHRYNKIFAVGGATAKKLNDYGYRVDAFPSKKASSESLLAMDEVKELSNNNILIFRGKGGRETLKKGLIKKNNQVEYIEVYKRVECEDTQLHKESLFRLLNFQDSVVTITSIESLSAMLSLIKKIDIDLLYKVQKIPLIVLSERIREFAKSVDFLQIYVATEPNNNGIVEKIQQIKLAKYNALDK